MKTVAELARENVLAHQKEVDSLDVQDLYKVIPYLASLGYTAYVIQESEREEAIKFAHDNPDFSFETGIIRWKAPEINNSRVWKLNHLRDRGLY